MWEFSGILHENNWKAHYDASLAGVVFQFVNNRS